MLNKVMLMGRLVADPILRYTNINQVAVASFTIAVDRRLIKGRDKETDFFNVVAWKTTADFVVKHFTKGQPICVDGRLQQRSWIDEATKDTRFTVEVVAESIYFAGYKKEDVQNDDVGYGEDFDPCNDESIAVAA